MVRKEDIPTANGLTPQTRTFEIVWSDDDDLIIRINFRTVAGKSDIECVRELQRALSAYINNAFED